MSEESGSKRDPRQLPDLIKRLLNSEGYDNLREALEDYTKKLQPKDSSETGSDED